MAGGVPVGNLILEVHVIELELPPVTPPAVTERVVPEREPDNCEDFQDVGDDKRVQQALYILGISLTRVKLVLA